MKSTGVLKLLRNSQVVTLKAKTDEGVWNGRATKTGGVEKKGYTLGAEFLQTFKDNFVDFPKSLEIVLRFEGNNLVLLAPKKFLKNLTFKIVSRSKVSGKKPLIVTESKDMSFMGSSYKHTVWAVVMGSPGADLTYSKSGSLPPGLSFSKGKHAIVGKPKKAGKWTVTLKAKNFTMFRINTSE